VVIIPQKTLLHILQEAPKDFGKEPKKYRYDVIFLKNPLTPTRAMKAVVTHDSVDEAYRGKHALYFKRLIAKSAQSKLPKLIQKPEYKLMTIRNWNTSTRLLSMLESL